MKTKPPTDGSNDTPDDAPAPGRRADIEPFWVDYQRACKIAVPGFSASALGHTRATADALAELVVTGVKRAQATPLRDFAIEPGADTAQVTDPTDDDDNDNIDSGFDFPQPGDHLVVLDGAGQPRAIVRTTHVEKRLFNQIDEAFAFEAGEGDLSLRWWLTAHRQDFAERAQNEGFEVHEGLALLLEYFELVWPVPVAGSVNELGAGGKLFS